MIAQILIDRFQQLIMLCPCLVLESPASTMVQMRTNTKRGLLGQTFLADLRVGMSPTWPAVRVRPGERMEGMMRIVHPLA